MYGRRYLLRDCAMELFFMDNTSYLFGFENKGKCVIDVRAAFSYLSTLSEERCYVRQAAISVDHPTSAKTTAGAQ